MMVGIGSNDQLPSAAFQESIHLRSSVGITRDPETGWAVMALIEPDTDLLLATPQRTIICPGCTHKSKL